MAKSEDKKSKAEMAQSKAQFINPIAMNDIAWAGRLYHVAPFWINRLTGVVRISLLVSALAMAAAAISVALRPPALLVGVYPDGRALCFPKLLDRNLNRMPMRPEYQQLCADLAALSGKKWDVSDFERQSDQDAVAPAEDPAEQASTEAAQPTTSGQPATTEGAPAQTPQAPQVSPSEPSIPAVNPQSPPPTQEAMS